MWTDKDVARALKTHRLHVAKEKSKASWFHRTFICNHSWKVAGVSEPYCTDELTEDEIIKIPVKPTLFNIDDNLEYKLICIKCWKIRFIPEEAYYLLDKNRPVKFAVPEPLPPYIVEVSENNK